MSNITKQYKGYKVNLSNRGNGNFSFFGYISICKNSWNSEYVLNHEIGHERQRKKYGNLRTLFTIYIPSVLNYWFGKLDFIQYNKQPWEAEANKLGGNEYWENDKYNQAIAEAQIR